MSIEPDHSKFNECTADITIAGGNLITVFAELDNAAETKRFSSGWGPPDAPLLLEAEPFDGGCDRRVLVPDGSSVLLSAVDPEVDRLCEIASELAEVAAARLANPGIGQRVWPSDSVLAASNACDLLTSEEVAPVTGSSTQSWPGFGNFSCQWGQPEATANNVTIVFARMLPLDDLDGQPGEIGGSPGRTSYKPGEQCRVIVQQRDYISDTGDRRIEAMRVHVYGPEPTTCSKATELAVIAKSRLASA